MGHYGASYHNKDRSYVRKTQQDRVWLAKPAGLFGDESLFYDQPSPLGSIYWMHCSNATPLHPLRTFNIQPKHTGKYHTVPYWVFGAIRLQIIWLVCAFVWQREKSVLQESSGRGAGAHCHAQWAACVCLYEGHSTVPHIKLSAPRLSRSSKWSLMAWGRVLSPNYESKAASVPGPRSLNLRIIQIQEIKIDASSFLLSPPSVCACPLVCFCCFPLCVLCTLYAIIYWSLQHLLWWA